LTKNYSMNSRRLFGKMALIDESSRERWVGGEIECSSPAKERPGGAEQRSRQAEGFQLAGRNGVESLEGCGVPTRMKKKGERQTKYLIKLSLGRSAVATPVGSLPGAFPSVMSPACFASG
jgi:hypothetical protein